MTIAPDPDRAPIFLIGCGRSGTSLLRSMLNAHPRIYLLQESAFFSWTGKLPGGWDGDRCLEFYFGTFSFAWLRIDPADVRAALPSPLPRGRLGDAYRAVMKIKAAKHDRVRFGDKNPMNSDCLGTVFESFPDARVVEVVRDPRAAVVSHTKVPFSSSSLLAVNRMLRRRVRAVQPFEDRIHFVRLEDLLREPRESIGKVLDFVGEPWDDAVLDHTRHTPKQDGIPFPWLLPGEGKPEARPPIWPQELSPAWIRLIESRHRGTMERFGYEPAVLPREPGALEQIGAALRELPGALRKVAWLLGATRRFVSGPVSAAEGQRIMHSANPRAWEIHPDWKLPDPPPVPSTDESSTPPGEAH